MELKSILGFVIKLFILFFLLLNLMTVMAILWINPGLHIWQVLLYVVSMILGIYSLFAIFLDEQKGILSALLCFGLIIFMNFEIEFRDKYPFLGILAIFVLWLSNKMGEIRQK